uniref:14-3-3 domain-containing protein n=1 Tax=Pyrodinium bahamense TaxID=73915 RepID=A0A7S0B9U1_9DINO
MAVCSKDTEQILPVVKMYKSGKEMRDQLYEFLRGGAVDLEVTVGQEMLVVEYDPIAILSELEQRDEESWRTTKNQVITSFAWMVPFTYHFEAIHDPIKKLLERIQKQPTKEDRQLTKEQILRELKNREELCNRFNKFMQDDEEISSLAEKYLRYMVDTVPERRFHLNHNEAGTQGAAKDGGHSKGGGKTVEQCIGEMLEKVKQESRIMDNWQLLIGWEPVQVKTAREAMHEAQRYKAMGQETEAMRCALRAASLGNELAGRQQWDPQQGLLPRDQDFVIFAGKEMVDEMLEQFENNKMSRSTFEDQFADLCDTMVTTLNNILASKDGPEHVAIYNRQLADYLRYLHVFVPRRRSSEDKIEAHYRTAENNAKRLRRRHLAGISTAVNFAVHCAEVQRDSAKAAAICRQCLTDDSTRKEEEDSGHQNLNQQINPSEVFNWDLLKQNLVAFETRIVILRVSFRLNSWKAHQKVFRKRDQGASGPGSAKGLPGSDAALGGQLTGRKAGLMNRRDKARGCFECMPRAADDTTGGGTPRTAADAGPGAAGSATPKQSEEDPLDDLRTVRRWLNSCPLRPEQNDDADSDGEEEGAARWRAIRWVDHAEPMETDEAEDITGPGSQHHEPLTRVTEKFQGVVKQVRLLNRMTHVSDASCSFLVGCAVRLPHSLLASAARGKSHDHEWTDDLEQELTKWPSESAEGSEQVKEVEVGGPELQSVLNNLNEDGLVKTESDKFNLFAGDVLLPPDDQQSTREYVKELCSEKKAENTKLKFLSCLQVNAAKCLAEGPYTDMHVKFKGFHDTGCIHTSKHFTSFNQMRKELATVRQRSLKAVAGTKPPRRIRGLSARRSPIQAAKRGCK